MCYSNKQNDNDYKYYNYARWCLWDPFIRINFVMWFIYLVCWLAELRVDEWHDDYCFDRCYSDGSFKSNERLYKKVFILVFFFLN